MAKKDIDKKFEQMSSECANNLTGTYPRKAPKKPIKKPVKKGK